MVSVKKNIKRVIKEFLDERSEPNINLFEETHDKFIHGLIDKFGLYETLKLTGLKYQTFIDKFNYFDITTDQKKSFIKSYAEDNRDELIGGMYSILPSEDHDYLLISENKSVQHYVGYIKPRWITVDTYTSEDGIEFKFNKSMDYYLSDMTDDLTNIVFNILTTLYDRKKF